MFGLTYLPCKVVEGHDRPSDIQRRIYGIRHKVDQVVLFLRYRARNARSMICRGLRLCILAHSACTRLKVRMMVLGGQLTSLAVDTDVAAGVEAWADERQ